MSAHRTRILRLTHAQKQDKIRRILCNLCKSEKYVRDQVECYVMVPKGNHNSDSKETLEGFNLKMEMMEDYFPGTEPTRH